MTLPDGLMELRKNLERAWCRKTAWPPDQKRWREDLPSIGQCYVTARIVMDRFGGYIIGTTKPNHSWNRFPDGTEVDLTADQFQDGRKVPDPPQVHPSKKLLRDTRMARIRYKMLKVRLEEVENAR